MLKSLQKMQVPVAWIQKWDSGRLFVVWLRQVTLSLPLAFPFPKSQKIWEVLFGKYCEIER